MQKLIVQLAWADQVRKQDWRTTAELQLANALYSATELCIELERIKQDQIDRSMLATELVP